MFAIFERSQSSAMKRASFDFERIDYSMRRFSKRRSRLSFSLQLVCFLFFFQFSFSSHKQKCLPSRHRVPCKQKTLYFSSIKTQLLIIFRFFLSIISNFNFFFNFLIKQIPNRNAIINGNFFHFFLKQPNLPHFIISL